MAHAREPSENLPGKQDSHPVTVGSGVNVPAAQFVHAELLASANCPGSHVSQEPLTVRENLPSWQSSHLPIDDINVPGSHSVHLELPIVENFPGTQSAHAVLPDALAALPASQFVHDELFAVATKLPTVHRVHVGKPRLPANSPG